MIFINHFFGGLGRSWNTLLGELFRISRLSAQSAFWIFFAPFRGKKGIHRKAFFEQMVFIGNHSLGIVALVALSIGGILALQSAYQLKQFGALIYTGGLVSISMTRELGPVIAAILIAGRVGASITAQLGTMKVSEELDAMVTMAMPLLPQLVIPRLLAMLIMLPVLTIITEWIAIMGSWMIGIFVLNISAGLYLQESFNALIYKDILTGLCKSFVFAFLIGIISIHKGLNVEGGAAGVGRATTESVVLSIIMIILADGLFTTIFYFLFP